MNFTVLLQPAIVVTTAAGVLFYFVRAMRRRSAGPAIAALWIGVVGLVVNATIVTVPPGHVAAVYSYVGGVQTRERPEGLTLVVPFLQSAYQMNVRTQKFFTPEAFAQSSDLQEITVHVAVGYHAEPRSAAELFRDVGRDYESVLIRPLVNQFVKAEVGQIKAVDFAQQRAQLATNIHAALAAELAPYGVIVEWVSIEDAVFDPAFVQAIKEKVIADEEADEQRRLVEAERHKKAQIILQAEAAAADIRLRADAQAEANRAVAESLTGDLLIWQRVIDWDGRLPETFIGNSDPLDLLFAINP